MFFGLIDPFPLLFTDTIELDARLVFSDVVDEFCSIRGVASRFESWRNTDAVAYREAYVSLCLPKVLGPLVRLKMLLWNPLQVNSAITNVEMAGYTLQRSTFSLKANCKIFADKLICFKAVLSHLASVTFLPVFPMYLLLDEPELAHSLGLWMDLK